MQKQGSKYRSITSMLNKIFEKHSLSSKFFSDTATNFLKVSHPLELKVYIYSFEPCMVYFCNCLFFLFCLFVSILIMMLQLLHSAYVCFFMYMHLLMCLNVDIYTIYFYFMYNLTSIQPL